VRVRRSISDSIRLFDRAFVLDIVNVVLVAGFLYQVFGQRLGLILHVFLKLIWALA